MWTEGDRSAYPPEFKSKVPNVAIAFQTIGMAVLIYGLVILDPLAAVTGVVIAQLARLWYIDRIVLPYEAMKIKSAEYNAWGTTGPLARDGIARSKNV